MRRHLMITAALLSIVACDDGDGGSDAEPIDSTIQDQGVADSAVVDADITQPPVIFLTNTVYQLESGTAGADAACMADPNNPGRGTFKALLGGTSRSICPQPDCAGGAQPVDWVLAANTTYQRTDGTVLFTTNADQIFVDWPMMAPLADGINQASGLDRDWTVRDGLHCDDWTSTNPDQEAGVGWTATFDSGGFLNGGVLDCGGRRPLVCVEQR